jgi:hypothetical protein
VHFDLTKYKLAKMWTEDTAFRSNTKVKKKKKKRKEISLKLKAIRLREIKE